MGMMSLFVLILISSSFANSKIEKNSKFDSSFLESSSKFRLRNHLSKAFVDEFISELGFNNANQNQEDEDELREENSGLFDSEQNERQMLNRNFDKLRETDESEKFNNQENFLEMNEGNRNELQTESYEGNQMNMESEGRNELQTKSYEGNQTNMESEGRNELQTESYEGNQMNMESEGRNDMNMKSEGRNKMKIKSKSEGFKSSIRN